MFDDAERLVRVPPDRLRQVTVGRGSAPAPEHRPRARTSYRSRVALRGSPIRVTIEPHVAHADRRAPDRGDRVTTEAPGATRLTRAPPRPRRRRSPTSCTPRPRIRESIETVIEGKAEVVRAALTVLLAEGHLLIEDVPGVGKTMLAKTLARSLDCSVRRIQFTPDLLPGDVTGVSVFNQETPRLRVPARRGVRQHRARRRDQPRLAQDAVGPARVHGGAPGHRRRHDLRAGRRRSWSSPRRTRSRWRAPTRCPRPSATASWPASRWATPTPQPRWTCSPSTRATNPLDAVTPVADAALVVAPGRRRARHPRGRRRSGSTPSTSPTRRAAPRRPPRRLAARHAAPRARRQGRRGPRRPRPRAARRPAAPRRPGARAPAASSPPTPRSPGAPPRPSSPTSCAASPVPAAGAGLTEPAVRAALRQLTRRGRLLLAARGIVGVLVSVAARAARPAARRHPARRRCRCSSALLVARTRYRSPRRAGCDPRASPSTSRPRASSASRTSRGCPAACCSSRTPCPGSSGRAAALRARPARVRRTPRRALRAARRRLRGRYTVGPVSVQLVDPFGLCRATRQFATTDTLTVVPATVAAARRIPLGGDWSGLGEARGARGLLRRRGRRDPARVPHRRRPAPRALEVHRPQRRAHGAARGAALAHARHRLPRHPCAWRTAATAPARRSSGRCRPPRSIAVPPRRVAATPCASSTPTATWLHAGPTTADGLSGPEAEGPLLDTFALVTHHRGRGARRRRRRRQARACATACSSRSSATSTSSTPRRSRRCATATRARWRLVLDTVALGHPAPRRRGRPRRAHRRAAHRRRLARRAVRSADRPRRTPGARLARAGVTAGGAR